MRSVASTIIAACWVTGILVWVAMAFFTKRTAVRGSRGWYGWQLAVALLLVLVFRALTRVPLHHELYDAPLVAVLAVVLVVASLALAIWARVTIGRNWSGAAVVKEGHELVVSGPYALVRHPIYTGILGMAIGTALNYAEPYGFLVVTALGIGFWLKLRVEEQLMTSEFPDEYPAYRRRVKALIPYVI